MAIIVGDKIYRNIQEQVAKNQDDIEELQEAVEKLPETTYSKIEIDEKLEGKFDKFVPTAGDVATIGLSDEEEYANLMLGVKNENDLVYSNYVVISGDGYVTAKASDQFEIGVQGNKGSFTAAKEHDIEITPDTGYDVNFKIGGLGKVCVTKTGQGALVKKEIALVEDVIGYTYSKQDVDDKDAATLTAAKNYADSIIPSTTSVYEYELRFKDLDSPVTTYTARFISTNGGLVNTSVPEDFDELLQFIETYGIPRQINSQRTLYEMIGYSVNGSTQIPTWTYLYAIKDTHDNLEQLWYNVNGGGSHQLTSTDIDNTSYELWKRQC